MTCCGLRGIACPIHETEFDLVIVADGIHSAARKLVVSNMEVDIVDTGWGI